MLSAVLMSVVMLIAITPIVVAPKNGPLRLKQKESFENY
jgi:hypothetical protein